MTEKQALAFMNKAVQSKKNINVGTATKPCMVQMSPSMVAIWSRRGQFLVVIHWPSVKKPEIHQ